MLGSEAAESQSGLTDSNAGSKCLHRFHTALALRLGLLLTVPW